MAAVLVIAAAALVLLGQDGCARAPAVKIAPDARHALSGLSATLAGLPTTLVDLPTTIADIPRTLADLPRTLTDVPRTLVDLPTTPAERIMAGRSGPPGR